MEKVVRFKGQDMVGAGHLAEVAPVVFGAQLLERYRERRRAQRRAA